MSYDISFKAKLEGIDRYIPICVCDANITWNVREIITRSTGLPWENEANNGLCIDIIPKIEKGYWELVRNPEKYLKYEPSNGYGTVEGTKQFFKEILDTWRSFAKFEDREFVNIITFWIE